MKICLVGGIYGKGELFRSTLQSTPETTLEEGFRDRGHFVKTQHHYEDIRLNEFDVVHVHHLSYGAVRAASSSSRVPFVFTAHGIPDISHTYSFRHWAFKFVLSSADAIVALTSKEANHYASCYGLGSDRCVVIPNGVDERVFHFSLKANKSPLISPKLLYVGQLIRLKRVDLLISALRLLPADTVLQLVYHVDELKQELQEQANALGLSGRLQFIGPCCHAKVAEFCRKADILVLPSSSEALPSVITEAMLCGTPVVATNVGGVGEQLSSFGVLVAPGDANRLAEGIWSVLHNYDTFRARARDMSQYAHRHFSKQAMISRHLELYERVAKQGVCGRRTQPCRKPANWIYSTGVKLRCGTR